MGNLYDFAANLFRKLCTKFHQNCLSFIEDITKNIFVSFFPDTVYILLIATVIKHCVVSSQSLRYSINRFWNWCRTWNMFSQLTAICLSGINNNKQPERQNKNQNTLISYNSVLLAPAEIKWIYLVTSISKLLRLIPITLLYTPCFRKKNIHSYY